MIDNIKCKHCGKTKEKHKSKRLLCPIGYIYGEKRNEFEPVEEGGNK